MPEQKWKAGDSFVAHELCIDELWEWLRESLLSSTELSISKPVVPICSSLLQGFSQIEEQGLKKGKL